jgi:hypothetical protein
MGTRAQFFIGDPRDVERRVWLGCIAWDGYPDGDCKMLAMAKTSDHFRQLVENLAATRDDFCDPVKHSFPFPWRNDLFLTDCTYAFFDGEVQFTYFHRGFIPLWKYSASEAARKAYHEGEEQLSEAVPAPIGEGPRGPDSIIVISAKGGA